MFGLLSSHGCRSGRLDIAVDRTRDDVRCGRIESAAPDISSRDESERVPPFLAASLDAGVYTAGRDRSEPSRGDPVARSTGANDHRPGNRNAPAYAPIGRKSGQSPGRRTGDQADPMGNSRQPRSPHRAARRRSGAGDSRRGDAGARRGRDRVPERGSAGGAEGGRLRDHAGRHQRAHGPRAGDGEGGARPLAVHHHAAKSRARESSSAAATWCSSTCRARRTAPTSTAGGGPAIARAIGTLLKLTQYFNCIHMAGGYPVEPVDIHPSVRHLDCLHDKLTLTDKVAHAYSLGTARVEDVMEMVRIAGGLTREEFDAKPRMYTNINSSSPLKHDWPMLDGAMRLARRGQPTIVTPVHPGRGDGSGDRRRRGDPVRGRGTVRHRAAPVREARGAVRHRVVHLERGHAHRRAGLRHAGVHPRDADLGSDGALLRVAAARVQRVCRELSRRTGRVGERVLAVVGGWRRG